MSAGPGTLAGSDLLFLGYLVLIVAEYLGASNMIPALKVIRFTTVLAYSLVFVVLLKARSLDLLEYVQTKILIGLIVFTTASVAWAVVTTYAFESIRPHLDSFGFFLLTVYLVDRVKRIHWVCGTFAFIVIVLVARNLDRLSATAREGVFRASYFLGDGNDFAWGMVTILPLAVYLLLRGGVLGKLLGLGGALGSLIVVVGTQSRGATLALGASIVFYWMFVARRKILSAAVVGVLAVAVLVAAPPQYFNRMGTLSHVEDDNSAQGRLRAWRAAVQMAVDFPLGVGAGNFNSAYGRYYVPSDAEGWAAGRWISPHSVYFLMLGEFGFLGLLLLVIVIGANLKANRRSQFAIRARPDGTQVPEVWPALLNMAIVGFAVGGVFLGGINYPHLYLLTGLTLSCWRMVKGPAGIDRERRDAAVGRFAADARLTPVLPVGGRPASAFKPRRDASPGSPTSRPGRGRGR